MTLFIVTVGGRPYPYFTIGEALWATDLFRRTEPYSRRTFKRLVLR